VVSIYYVLVFELFILDRYCSEDVKVLYYFILRLAVSCEVAWLAIVITVIILFLIAVTLSVTKLFL
jgi:hypothetical protein